MTSFKRYTTNIDNKTKNILCLKLELTLNKLESNIEKVSTQTIILLNTAILSANSTMPKLNLSNREQKANSGSQLIS